MGPESFLKSPEKIEADAAPYATASIVAPSEAEVEEHGGTPQADHWVKVWGAADGREAHRHSETGQMRYRRGEGDEWVSPADGHAPWVKEEHKQAHEKAQGPRLKA